MNAPLAARNHPLSAVMLALLLGLLATCSTLDQSPHPAPDGDSDTPEIEFEGETELNGTVSIEVIPPADSGFLTEQFRAIDLAHFDGRLTLRNTETTKGAVMCQGTLTVPFTMLFSRIGPDQSILGHPLSTASVLTSEGLIDGQNAGLFSLPLLPGIYQVLIEPQSGSPYPTTRVAPVEILSPPYFTVFQASPGTAVCGELRNAGGLGLENVEVWATGQLAGQRSNRALSGANGAFCLNIADNESAVYDIHIGPSNAQPMLPLRVFTQAIVQAAGGLPAVSNTYQENGLLVLRYDDFSREECELNGRIVDVRGNAVIGARVALSAPSGGGRFTANASTDGQGWFSLRLLRETGGLSTKAYSLRVLPPDESDSTILPAMSLNCADSRVFLPLITLSPRLTLTGTLRDERGVPVPKITVVATKLATSEDSLVYVKKTSSDAQGIFVLKLDAGTYDVSIQPTANSGLGWQVLSALQTSADAVLPITLHPGVWLRGVLRDDQGAALPWAYIDIYHERPALGRSEKIGAGQSAADGRFEILLPR